MVSRTVGNVPHQDEKTAGSLADGRKRKATPEALLESHAAFKNETTVRRRKRVQNQKAAAKFPSLNIQNHHPLFPCLHGNGAS
jgi:hypothetical protein